MIRFLSAVVVLFAAASNALAGLQIGDKAPKVKAAQWMTTPPPTLPGEKDADKHVFIVEFWATWCGPCRQSIPHLAELHRKVEKDGVIVIGMSNETPEVIQKFLKKPANGKGIDMPYHVASDDDNATNEAWMKDIDGIPHAFIVDKTGAIVWLGHPMDPGMENALKQVMSGKYDIKTAKQSAESTKKYEALMQQAREAAGEKDPEKLFKLIDQMIALKPAEVMPYLMKRHFLGEFDRLKEIPAMDLKMEEAMKDSVEGLKDIVDFQLERPLPDRNAGLLFRSVRRADELTQNKNSEVLARLARVQCEFGMLDAAITTQEKAIAGSSDSLRDEYQKVLQYFKDSKELAAKGK